VDRILIVGLEEPEFKELRDRTGRKLLHHEMLPRIVLDRGRFLVERLSVAGSWALVSAVVFHGIFEDDFPFLTALALWGGPCLPNALGMMDCRQRVPGLVRALQVTRFGHLPRGFATAGTTAEAETDTVAKWGEWHCGENKARFTGRYQCEENTLFEPFMHGEAVRVHVTGDRAWQLRLTGDGWLKSIHHQDAAFMPLDPELHEDVRRLQQHFKLEMLAVDYIVGPGGAKFLLEVNHIPNVTLFPELRAAYLDLVTAWLDTIPGAVNPQVGAASRNE
jgi:hypothetical protein